jgi:hypothetical protein
MVSMDVADEYLANLTMIDPDPCELPGHGRSAIDQQRAGSFDDDRDVAPSFRWHRGACACEDDLH